MTNTALQKRQGARLAQARKAAGYRSARAAALENEWGESTYRSHENGGRTIGQDDAERYARRFRAAGVPVKAQDILFGGETAAEDVESNVVRVVGKVGAGAEISPDVEQVPPEGLAEIELPFPTKAGALAFQVEGDSMWPAYFDGDVILCGPEAANASEIVGQEAAVQTIDGRRFVKKVLAGQARGTFDLESHNAPPIRGVRLEWAAQVDMIVRRANQRLVRRVTAAR